MALRAGIDPCPGCNVEPTFYKGDPGFGYRHHATCLVGNMTNRSIRLGGTSAPVRPKLSFVCSRDSNHSADASGPCPFCWAEAEILVSKTR